MVDIWAGSPPSDTVKAELCAGADKRPRAFKTAQPADAVMKTLLMPLNLNDAIKNCTVNRLQLGHEVSPVLQCSHFLLMF